MRRAYPSSKATTNGCGSMRELCTTLIMETIPNLGLKNVPDLDQYHIPSKLSR